MHGHNMSQFHSISSPHAHFIAVMDIHTFQVVAGAVAEWAVEVVLVESSTRPTTQSHLAQPTPLLLARGGREAIILAVMV
jgi:hypothetical protein